nr:hypothetical protein [uncultured Flavobacterium sp.]
MDIITVVNAVSPSFESIKKEIAELKRSYPSKNKTELAELYGDRLKRKYTSVGVVSALPSAIPGVGTAAQVAVEVGTMSGDLALMLRWMAANCYGIALIYDKDISSEFNEEFVRILGLWSGVIHIAKKGTALVATKVAVVHFNKAVTGKMVQQINKKVGVTIFTKYGAKRGGIALGRLIPFGVGALVGGTFNYFTMNGFKKAAIKYYKTEDLEFYMEQ